MPPTPVYLVAAPIGDYLQDMSVSALHTLHSIEHVFVEADDEYLAQLREHAIIGDRHHVHLFDESQVTRARELIGDGTPFAILASSGLPCFFDPGYEIVNLCLELGPDDVELIPLGVSSALDAALCMCGRNVKIFRFNGHYPVRYVLDHTPRDDGTTLVYFVEGDALRQFLTDVHLKVSNLARVILLKDIRKRGRARVTVLRPSAAGFVEPPPNAAGADYTCVIHRSVACERDQYADPAIRRKSSSPAEGGDR